MPYKVLKSQVPLPLPISAIYSPLRPNSHSASSHSRLIGRHLGSDKASQTFPANSQHEQNVCRIYELMKLQFGVPKLVLLGNLMAYERKMNDIDDAWLWWGINCSVTLEKCSELLDLCVKSSHKIDHQDQRIATWKQRKNNHCAYPSQLTLYIYILCENIILDSGIYIYFKFSSRAYS